MLVIAGACRPAVEDIDQAYFDWDDRRVLCGIGLDDRLDISIDDIRAGLERAADNEQVLLTYAHDPGQEVSFDRLEAVLEAAVELGVDFVTYPELSSDPADRRAGLALSFDDTDIDDWLSARDLFAEYGARVTFFVTRVGNLSQLRIDDLHTLAGDGHAIESHSANHLDATEYVAEHGLDAWEREELVAGLEQLRDAGFEPTAFAYPFGYRSDRIDRVALRHVRYTRSLSWTFGQPVIQSPCGQ